MPPLRWTTRSAAIGSPSTSGGTVPAWATGYWRSVRWSAAASCARRRRPSSWKPDPACRRRTFAPRRTASAACSRTADRRPRGVAEGRDVPAGAPPPEPPRLRAAPVPGPSRSARRLSSPARCRRDLLSDRSPARERPDERLGRPPPTTDAATASHWRSSRRLDRGRRGLGRSRRGAPACGEPPVRPDRDHRRGRRFGRRVGPKLGIRDRPPAHHRRHGGRERERARVHAARPRGDRLAQAVDRRPRDRLRLARAGEVPGGGDRSRGGGVPRPVRRGAGPPRRAVRVDRSTRPRRENWGRVTSRARSTRRVER